MEQLCLKLILSKSKIVISRIISVLSIWLLQLKFSKLVVLGIYINNLMLHVDSKPSRLYPIKKLLLLFISICC